MAAQHRRSFMLRHELQMIFTSSQHFAGAPVLAVQRALFTAHDDNGPEARANLGTGKRALFTLVNAATGKGFLLSHVYTLSSLLLAVESVLLLLPPPLRSSLGTSSTVTTRRCWCS